jgi:class 3 adenylate cyclase
MPNTEFTYIDIPADESKYGKGLYFFATSRAEFDSFDSSVLGLGDVSQEGQYVQALAAIYDLEGFTSFCNQVDPHLVVPDFLKLFIDWLFSSLAKLFKESEKANMVALWSKLPVFTKFMGDGILLLWDTKDMSNSSILNVIAILSRVTKIYPKTFLAEAKKHVSNPPPRLRCGVARGQVITVGDGNDYVGPCINIASRLQKLSQLTFAVSRRGVDISIVPSTNKAWQPFVLKKVSLRGIGDEELVYVDKDELRKLPADERKLFKNP